MCQEKRARYCCVDVMGPLLVTESGHKYIIVVADYFTKWTAFYPLPDQEAYSTEELLLNLECHYFTSVLSLTQSWTTPCHPKSNGMVERFN